MIAEKVNTGVEFGGPCLHPFDLVSIYFEPVVPEVITILQVWTNNSFKQQREVLMVRWMKFLLTIPRIWYAVLATVEA